MPLHLAAAKAASHAVHKKKEALRTFPTTNRDREGGLPPEFPVLLAAHPNVLIVASEETHEAAVQGADALLASTSDVMPSPSESALPSSGSVILRSIGDLTLQAQEALFSWLEGRGKNTQVVSLSPVQLFPLVTSGRFLGGPLLPDQRGAVRCWGVAINPCLAHRLHPSHSMQAHDTSRNNRNGLFAVWAARIRHHSL